MMFRNNSKCRTRDRFRYTEPLRNIFRKRCFAYAKITDERQHIIRLKLISKREPERPRLLFISYTYFAQLIS